MTDAIRKLVTMVFCSALIAHASALFSPNSAWGAEYIVTITVHGRVLDHGNQDKGVEGIYVTAKVHYVYHPYMIEGEPQGYSEEWETKSAQTDNSGFFTIIFELDKWLYAKPEISAEMLDSPGWLLFNTTQNLLFDTSAEYYFYILAISDADGNGIHDSYEWDLLQKFCPSFTTNVSDPYLFPNPVQALGGEYNTELYVTMVIDDRIKHEFYGAENVVPIHADLIEYAGPDMKFIPIMKFGAWGNREDITKPDILNLPSNPIPLYFNDYLRIRKSPDAAADTIAVSDITRRYMPNNYPFASAKLYIHYDLPGSNPADWYIANRDNPFKTRYTVYGTIWREGNTIAIQYWFFYTYNDWKNDHEGDWEHINVLLTSQSPYLAEIDKVQFYFHSRWKEWETRDLDIENGTHVMVYIGGSYHGGGYNGHMSNGSYPDKALWNNAGGSGDDDVVLGWGRRLNWHDITWSPDQPNDAFGMELIKDPSHLIQANFFVEDNRKYGYYSWLIKDIFWGEPANHPENKKIASYHGPTFKDGWRSLGSSGDFSSY